MHAPSASAHDPRFGSPDLSRAPVDDDELVRARAAVASIARVRDQLAESQRSLEAYIARAVADADQRRAAYADRARAGRGH